MSGLDQQRNSVLSAEPASTAMRPATPPEDRGTSAPSPDTGASSPSTNSLKPLRNARHTDSSQVLRKIFSAMSPLPKRKPAEQILAYNEHPDFVNHIPAHQRRIMDAVQAYAPELSFSLAFYRNILPNTLRKMIAFKKRMAVLALDLSDETLMSIHKGLIDLNALIGEKEIRLTDMDVYDAHVIAVTYMIDRAKQQMLAEQSGEGLNDPNTIDFSYPSGPSAYAATVALYSALSKILPKNFRQGVVSHLAHTLNDVSQPSAESYRMRHTLFETVFTSNARKFFSTGLTGATKIPGIIIGTIVQKIGSRLIDEATASYQGNMTPKTLDDWKKKVYADDHAAKLALGQPSPAVLIERRSAPAEQQTTNTERPRDVRANMHL